MTGQRLRNTSLSALCGGLVLVACLVVFVGWQLDQPALRSILPGQPQTMPLTALMLLLLSGSLIVSRLLVSGKLPTNQLWLCWALAAITGLAALWTLGQYLFDLGPGIESLMFPDAIMRDSGSYPGRPSPHTGITGALLALAIGLSPLAQRWARLASLVAGVGGFVVTWTALFGYVTLSGLFYSLPESPETGMSLVTALCFLTLWVGLMALRPTEGLPGLLKAHSSGSLLLRLLLPVAVLVPLVFGWLAVYETQFGIMPPRALVALNWGFTSLLLAGLIIWGGFIVHHRDSRIVRAQDELAQLNQNLEQLASRRTAELESFSYSVAHDLQSPLRSISGFAGMLARQDLAEESQHYLNRISANTRRMSQIISDLMALAQVTRSEIRRAPVDLTQLARAITANLQEQQPDRRLDLEVAPSLVAHSDANLVSILMENLLGNAWKYTGRNPDAQVKVGATREDGRDVYYVSDNGAGFDMAHADRLFTAFHRLHRQEEFEGSGIGLAIAHRIVSRHGGHIWAEAAVGQGATFYFTLE